MEIAEHAHQLLRLDRVGEVRVAAQVAEEHGHLPPVAAQDGVVTGVDDRVRELRRKEALQAPQPLQLLDLVVDALLERPVQLLDLVVVALDAQERADTGRAARRG